MVDEAVFEANSKHVRGSPLILFCSVKAKKKDPVGEFAKSTRLNEVDSDGRLNAVGSGQSGNPEWLLFFWLE